jgi:hypothetical protein
MCCLAADENWYIFLYNKIVRVLREIMSVRALTACGSNSANRWISVSRAVTIFMTNAYVQEGVDVIIALWVRKAEPLVSLHMRILKQFIIFYTYSYMNSCIFWVVTPCRRLKLNQRLEGTSMLCLLPVHVGFLFGLFSNHDDESNMFLRNFRWLSTALHTRR